MGKRINSQWIRWGLIGLLVLLGVLVISSPLIFRILPLQYQAGIARRVPILSVWVLTNTPAPTRAYGADTLPTADPSRAAAEAMELLKATSSPTASPLPATATNEPTITATPTHIKGTLLPTNTPRNTLTLVPSATPTPTNTATYTATPLPIAWHSSYTMWVPQKWNNCGPANMTQALGMLGYQTTQEEAAAWLKPNPNDANVSAWQLVAYVNGQTPMRAVERFNGNLELMKRLLLARFAVLVETGLELPGEDWMGHYVTLIGYDDPKQYFSTLDTFLGTGDDGQGMHEPYNKFDKYWQHFNRVYVVVYQPEREGELNALLGKDADPGANSQGALERALAEAQEVPSNPYAWFNVGSSFVLLRNYPSAVKAYDQARSLGLPWRMLWYQFGPLFAYYHVGDYATTLELIKATFGTTVHVEEIWYWRGMVRAAQGDKNQAIEDFNAVLKFNPNFSPAVDALASVQAGQIPPAPDMT